jgi:hypothetical protein
VAKKKEDFIPCYIKQLDELDDMDAVKAADYAVRINPANAPRLDFPAGAVPDLMTPARIAALTSKYWGTAGVKLTVSFMETTTPELQEKILAYANKWAKHCNVTFVLVPRDGDVRISRGKGGYWSYLGSDIRGVARHRQTMNLEGFVLNTPEAEYERVVVHEFGHTLSFPHEHLRKELVDKLDVQKTIAYFKKYQGWDEDTTRSNVLTPIDDRSLTGASPIDPQSIMCYQLSGQITKDGKPIPGGNTISSVDSTYVNKMYPKAVTPTDPTGPATGVVTVDAGKKVVYAPADWTFQIK